MRASPPLATSLCDGPARLLVGCMNGHALLFSVSATTEGGMLASSPDAAHVVSLCEVPLGDPVHPDATGATAAGEWDPDGTWLGLCVCDAATGRFLVGAFRDDSARSRLRALLAELRPVEALLPRGQLSGATLAALRSAPRPPQERPMPPGERFWSAQKTTEELESAQYFQDNTQGTRTVAGGDANRRGRLACWPAALASLVTAQCAGASPAPAQALSALGGMLSHLRDSLLDRDLVPLGRFSALALFCACCSAILWLNAPLSRTMLRLSVFA